MLKLYATIGPVKAPQFKTVPTLDGRGRTRVQSGVIVGEVEIYIDVSKLQDKAWRAMKNRSKKSVLAQGGIVFKAVNLRNEV